VDASAGPDWSELSQSPRGAFLDDKAAVLEALQVAAMETVDINQIFTLVLNEGGLLVRGTFAAPDRIVEKAVLTDEGIRLGLRMRSRAAVKAPATQGAPSFRFVR